LLVSARPLVFVGALTTGDVLLWNWSLSSGHYMLALVSGLTLPPLAAACVLLIVLTAARVASSLTRRAAGPGSRRMAAHARTYLRATRPRSARTIVSPAPATAERSREPERKLAA
jgi:hypothetical protein